MLGFGRTTAHERHHRRSKSLKLVTCLLALQFGLACWTPLLEMPTEWEQHEEDLASSTEEVGREVSRSYFNKERTVLSHEMPLVRFSDGHLERDGLERAWYEDGTPRLEQPWKKGRRVGLSRRWTKDGVLLMKIDRGDGKSLASMEFWHPNGFPSGAGMGIDGVKEGTWVTWFPNGKKRSEGTYAKGLRDGTWTFWDESGSMLEQGSYKGGRRIGKWAPNSRIDQTPDK